MPAEKKAANRLLQLGGVQHNLEDTTINFIPREQKSFVLTFGQVTNSCENPNSEPQEKTYPNLSRGLQNTLEYTQQARAIPARTAPII